MYEKKISELLNHFEAERARNATVEEELNITKKLLNDGQANLKVSYSGVCNWKWLTVKEL